MSKTLTADWVKQRPLGTASASSWKPGRCGTTTAGNLRTAGHTSAPCATTSWKSSRTSPKGPASAEVSTEGAGRHDRDRLRQWGRGGATSNPSPTSKEAAFLDVRVKGTRSVRESATIVSGARCGGLGGPYGARMASKPVFSASANAVSRTISTMWTFSPAAPSRHRMVKSGRTRPVEEFSA